MQSISSFCIRISYCDRLAFTNHKLCVTHAIHKVPTTTNFAYSANSFERGKLSTRIWSDVWSGEKLLQKRPHNSTNSTPIFAVGPFDLSSHWTLEHSLDHSLWSTRPYLLQQKAVLQHKESCLTKIAYFTQKNQSTGHWFFWPEHRSIRVL